jgi:hypothetical protein
MTSNTKARDASFDELATTDDESGEGLARRVAGTAGGAVASAGGAVATAVGTAAGVVAGTAGTVKDQLPQAVEVGSRIVDTTGEVANRAAERLKTEPEDRLVAGSTFLFGVALGLFIAGSPRVLVGLALAPAVALGLAFAERHPAKISTGSSSHA